MIVGGGRFSSSVSDTLCNEGGLSGGEPVSESEGIMKDVQRRVDERERSESEREQRNTEIEDQEQA